MTPTLVDGQTGRKDAPLQPPTAEPVEESVSAITTAISVRSQSSAILTVLGVIVFARWAQEILVPITLAVLLSYALTPIVAWLESKLNLHKAIGAAIVLVSILGALGAGVAALQPQALAVVDLVPRATQKMTDLWKGTSKGERGAVAAIERAASEIEKAANVAPEQSTVTVAKAPPTPAAFKIRDYFWNGTMGLMTGLGQFVTVVALVYFLLIAGDSFRRTLMRISEATLSSKKITVQMLDDIDAQIQRYLLVQIATSALLGAVIWGLLAWIGLENAATWAVVGGVLHLVPYAGPALLIALLALVAFVQFDTLQPVLTIVGGTVVATGIIGLLLVPWLTHKTGTLNAVTVFVSLLIWGWLWGVWGLLLGVPVMMAIKALCDRVENLRTIGAFLGHPDEV